jgi:lipoyl(octanoyl) transferase
MSEPLIMPAPSIGWAVSPGLTPYLEAVEAMERRAEAIAAGQAEEVVWMVEHPPVYTAGTSAKPADLVDPDRFPVIRTGRGGQYTYHGPGQRVAYVMLDLRQRGGRDVRLFVQRLEAWLIGALAEFSVKGETRPDRIGVWVVRKSPAAPPREDKIAALGIRLRRWVSFHGVSLNVEPELSHFDGIVPCGIREHGVTSLVDLGLPITMQEADAALRTAFEAEFGPTHDAPPLFLD